MKKQFINEASRYLGEPSTKEKILGEPYKITKSPTFEKDGSIIIEGNGAKVEVKYGTPLEKIAEFCLGCMGYERKRVKECNGRMVYGFCPLNDFRMGKNPKNKTLKTSPLKAISYKCLICMGHLDYLKPAPKFRHHYVKECDSPECPLYPYRTGKPIPEFKEFKNLKRIKNEKQLCEV